MKFPKCFCALLIATCLCTEGECPDSEGGSLGRFGFPSNAVGCLCFCLNFYQRFSFVQTHNTTRNIMWYFHLIFLFEIVYFIHPTPDFGRCKWSAACASAATSTTASWTLTGAPQTRLFWRQTTAASECWRWP